MSGSHRTAPLAGARWSSSRVSAAAEAGVFSAQELLKHATLRHPAVRTYYEDMEPLELLTAEVLLDVRQALVQVGAVLVL
jgi:hypothetical protein